jgi:hypothetical protein
MSSLASPSSRLASIRSTVSVVSGRVRRSGYSFLRPMALFRTYDIDDGLNISYVRNHSKGNNMTTQQNLTAKISTLSTATVKQVCREMNVRMDDEASVVLSASLNDLMARISTEDFQDFCAELEAT